MKRGQGRPQRIGDLIQRELSDLLAREVRDPRVGMVTLTSVDVSPDMSHARVLFTVLQQEKIEEVHEGLRRAAGFLRGQIGRRVRIHTTPELRFVHDQSTARAYSYKGLPLRLSAECIGGT